MADYPAITVMHYTGASDDRGGVMSVLHALAGAGKFECLLGVNPDFVPRRVPPLPAIAFPPIACETLDGRTLWRARAVARRARAWLEEDRGRVFHAHSRAGLVAAMWLARGGERRVVVSVHCYGRQRWFYRHAARQLGHRLFWLSPAMKRYYGVATDDSWTQCIPGCVPALRLALPARERRSREVLCLGGIGAVVLWKGWHVVVDAIAALPPEVRERVRFDHIGATGNTPDARRYAAELRATTTRLGLANVITWRGEQPSSSKLLHEIDVLVVASHNEPFSIAVLEALAAGVPVLAADSGGAQDLIADGQCGWFFRRGESSQLAARIAMLASTSALDEVKVTEELIRPFTAPVVADQWARVYAALTTADAHY